MKTPNNKKSTQQLETLLQQQATKIAQLERGQAIDAAIERIRAKALVMHHSYEVKDVANAMRTELMNLGIAGVSAATIWIEQSKDKVRAWDFTNVQEVADSKDLEVDFVIDLEKGRAHPKAYFWNVWNNKKATYSVVESNIETLYASMNWLVELDETMGKELLHLLDTQQLTYWWHASAAIRKGTITIDFVTPPPVEMAIILPKMAAAFDLAYRRFEDLEKAETQAKDAQIEAALERVRARAMAMHKSEELQAVVQVLYQQLNQLELFHHTLSIALCEPSDHTIEYWMEDATAATHLKSYTVKGRKNHVFQKIWKAWKVGLPTYSLHLSEDNKWKFDTYLFEETGFKELPDPSKKEIRRHKVLYMTCVNMAYGYLEVADIEPMVKADIPILQKFAKVFEQTYTRFLDLQKAEAQAKEAQIEAALERVRSRTMAIHRSEELNEVVGVLYQQFAQLTNNWGIELGIFNKRETTIEIFRSNIETAAYPKSYYIKGKGHRVLKQYWQIWEDQAANTLITLKGKAQKNFLQYLLTHTDFKDLPESDKKVMEVPLVHLQFAPMQYGFLMVATIDAPFQQEDFVILNRFAKVFEQTYTRFLDIQKAEAQAKEAQIEAALERVRAQTMAMHKSTELSDIVKVLYQEIKPFGFAAFSCTIHLLDKKTQNTEVWMEDITGTKHLQSYYWYGRENSIINQMWETWEQQLPIWDLHLKAEEKRDLDDYLFEKTDYQQFPEEVKNQIRSSNEVHFTMAYFKHGCITVTGFIPPLPTQREIIQRFANVFDQTYTRFLDLQRAEAQAREAQIEAALERVRASTMAMHHSSELSDAVKVLFAQFQNLKIDTVANWIGFIDVAANTMEIWSTSGEKSRPAYTVNGADYHNFQADIDAFKNKKAYRQHSIERAMAIEVLQEQFEFELNLPDEATHYHLLQMRHEFGFLGYGSWQEANAEVFPVLERFCGVFEQTYTRFLDLQKAEAQVREAQIEAALERVRARAMAMRRSDELSEAAELLYHEFFKLGVEPFSCGYLINDDEKGEWRIWLTNPGEPFFKEYWTIPYTADHNLQARYESWKNKEAFHCAVLEGAANQAHHQVICQYAPWKEEVTPNLAPQLVFNSAHFSLGHLLVISPDRLSSELEQAMVRFASVFDLTYRRFLDLEKAEEQNRQLEKVFNENQRLLHSILPEQIAEQIRKGQKTVVKRFEEVSILFADIVGFTILSEKLSPQKVVDILNGLFSKFDDLTDKYQLEKIKTIGDAYMVAAGVPEEKTNHAQLMFAFAKEMLQTLQDFNQAMGGNLKIRIGISSGPVVAGVIGKKKFAYDLWGDTVNTAARMEANGRADCIQVSPTTYAILKKEAAFEKIPNVEIKGKGMMDVYLWTPSFTG